MNDGWIKLHRSLLDHWVWQDPVALKLWTYLLFCANFDDRKRMVGGTITTVERGDVLTSLARIAKDTHLTVQNVRTLLRHFERDGMIAQKSTRKSTHLSICNYDSYQDSQHTNQHTPNTRLTYDQQHNKKERKKEEDNTPLTPLKGGDVAKPRRRDQRWHEYRWYLEQRQKGVDNDRMEMRVVDGKAQYRMKS